MVDVIQGLVDDELNSTKELDASKLMSVVKKLTEVVDISRVEPPVGTNIVGVVAKILLSDTDVMPVADMWVWRGDRLRMLSLFF